MKSLLAFCFVLPLLAADKGEWPVYGHDAGGTKYSPLAQIDRGNVARLKPAWTFHAGDMYVPKDGNGRPSGFETTPLYVDGTLYLTTAFGRIIALDPVTGKERWNYAPKVKTSAGFGDFVNRGAAMWTDGKTGARRLFVATIDAQLVAVDAAQGRASMRLAMVAWSTCAPDYAMHPRAFRNTKRLRHRR